MVGTSAVAIFKFEENILRPRKIFTEFPLASFKQSFLYIYWKWSYYGYVSFQEVETDQFYNFFLPELKQDGYDGIFSPKSRAKTMSESERKYVDGCAIFFRSAK